MNILLHQPDYNSTIEIFILAVEDQTDSWESYGHYIKISTSSIFDPYPALYDWLQLIANSHLPAEITIDEEGRGMTLVVEDAGNGNVTFTVKPWMRKNQTEAFLRIKVDRIALVQAFAAGITGFIKQGYEHNRWYAQGYHDLRDIPWNKLLSADKGVQFDE